MRHHFNGITNYLPFVSYRYRGEKSECNLCGTAEGITVGKIDRRLKPHHSIACAKCGLIRTDPMPTENELDEYYEGEYRLDYQLAFRSKPPRYHVNRSMRAARQRWGLLAPLIRPASKVLDFGAGSGEFLALAQATGHDATGIEPTATFAQFARKAYGVKVFESTWQNIDFPPKNFDLITANHVIEHLARPVDALKKMTQWLTDDGVIFIAVPDVTAQREQSFQHFHFAHVYNFTPESLRWAGMVAGLEPDPRFPNTSTTVVFRNNGTGPVVPKWPAGEGERIASMFTHVSAFGFFASGSWAIAAIRRLKKTIRDSRSTHTG